MKVSLPIERNLFRTESNAQLEIFRIAFGFLMLAEAWGALALGWVTETFVDVKYTFPFFGFEWTQILLGTPMYVIFAIMGIAAIGVMLGYKYRFSIVLLAILWSLAYFMQKTHYNNHYYLVMLVSWIFVFLPVGRRFSLDARLNPLYFRDAVPAWPRMLLMSLIAIVYFYAAIAKLYPDWLEAKPLKLWLSTKTEFPLIGNLFQADWFPYFMAYSGIGYDLLIIPLLLWKPTRWIAVIASIGFHLFNSAVFQIGIFPYFALSFSLFFFPNIKVEKLVNRNYSALQNPIYQSSTTKKWVRYGFILFLSIMLLLPVRHHFIPDDVLWTEAGHRLSWRMMLRTKAGIANYQVIADGEKKQIDMRERLAPHQLNDASVKPDLIYSFARKLEAEFKQKGYENIEVYANARVSVNGRPYHQFTREDVNLLSVRWNYFGNQDWLLPRPW